MLTRESISKICHNSFAGLDRLVDARIIEAIFHNHCLIGCCVMRRFVVAVPMIMKILLLIHPMANAFLSASILSPTMVLATSTKPTTPSKVLLSRRRGSQRSAMLLLPSKFIIRKPPNVTITSIAKIRESWFRWPEPFRFFVSGNCGNLCLYICDILIGTLCQHRSIHPAVSFFLAYLLHIPAQHFLHACLVYGMSSINSYSKYITTLLETYSALGVSAVGSAALNGFLRHYLPRLVAFGLTMAIFAIVNYTFMHFIMSNHDNAEHSQRKS